MFWKKKKAKFIDPLQTRWHFADKLTENEKLIHNEVSKLIDTWWLEFKKHEKKIDDAFTKGIDFDIVNFMSNNLNIIHNNICWEFGPAVNGDGHRLVITPESFKKLRPLVYEILRRAPKLDRWEFYGHRLPENHEKAIKILKSKTGSDLSDFNVQSDINDLNQINLYFTCESCRSEEEFNQAYRDVFVIAESLLGEENLDKWIGLIEVDNKLKDSLEVKSIDKLKDLFTNKLHEIKYNQLENPHFETSRSSTWSMFKLEPQKQKDYSRQNDIFIIKAMNLPMRQTVYSNNLFYSERFSNFGEVFCYVKIDGTSGLDNEKFEDKASIEEALDNALIKEKAGCFIGGGTGLKYSYIDLALNDLDKGIKLVKDVLRKGNITKNSWILFFDSELEYEWIGIWDDSPKPFFQEDE